MYASSRDIEERIERVDSRGAGVSLSAPRRKERDPLLGVQYSTVVVALVLVLASTTYSVLRVRAYVRTYACVRGSKTHEREHHLCDFSIISLGTLKATR